MKFPSRKSRLIVAVFAPIAVIGGALSVVAARYEPLVRPNTFVGPVAVGGLTSDEAAHKLRLWWQSVKANPLRLEWKGHPDAKFPDTRPSLLNTILDDKATLALVPFDGIVSNAEHATGIEQAPRTDIKPVFKAVGQDLSDLDDIVLDASNARPAKFGWDGRQVYVKPEVPGYEIDADALPAAVGEAVLSGQAVEIPVKQQEKHVPDSALSQITDLVSTYTTHFPVRQFNRNNNIMHAAAKLNGVVLMPGEDLSFNKTVGRRTIQEGFKDAPVYKNGKHDHGIGGGICQVSSTLYNASLLGNLKIVRRSNHSMPVAYVPLGRDATVDYGSIDLEVRNSYDTPIAICSAFTKGSLTFRVFGKRDPSIKIRIERTGQSDWMPTIQYVSDAKLKPGKQEIVEKGSWGHRILTYRLIYKDGKLIKREPLGLSYYRPSTRVIARGPTPALALPTVNGASAASTVPVPQSGR